MTVPLEDIEAPEPPPERPLLAWIAEVPKALVYPLRPPAIGAILLVAFIWASAHMLVLMLLFILPLMVLLYAYTYKILLTSASGEPGLPPAVAGFNALDDLVDPLRHVLSVLLLCYLPALVAIALTEERFWIEGIWMAIFYVFTSAFWELPTMTDALRTAGMLYFPTALLAVTVNEDLRAASPRTVLRAVARAPVPLLLITGAFLAVNRLRVASLRWFFMHWNTAFWTQCALEAGVVYAHFVLARLLGMTHWCYRKRLGWLKRV